MDEVLDEVISSGAYAVRFWEVVGMAMVIDPVCGMRIDDAEAAGTAEHDGRTYSFCSEVCREVFEADPASYSGAEP